MGNSIKHKWVDRPLPVKEALHTKYFLSLNCSVISVLCITCCVLNELYRKFLTERIAGRNFDMNRHYQGCVSLITFEQYKTKPPNALFVSLLITREQFVFKAVFLFSGP